MPVHWTGSTSFKLILIKYLSLNSLSATYAKCPWLIQRKLLFFKNKHHLQARSSLTVEWLEEDQAVRLWRWANWRACGYYEGWAASGCPAQPVELMEGVRAPLAWAGVSDDQWWETSRPLSSRWIHSQLIADLQTKWHWKQDKIVQIKIANIVALIRLQQVCRIWTSDISITRNCDLFLFRYYFHE